MEMIRVTIGRVCRGPRRLRLGRLSAASATMRCA